jgi:sensor histidine kinase regulating citrate/malate metabolism
LEKRGMISSENLHTIVVVGFILALLALVLAIFNAYKMGDAAHVAGDWLNHYATSSAETHAEMQSLRTRVGTLETELAEAKKIMAQPIVVDVSLPAIDPAP